MSVNVKIIKNAIIVLIMFGCFSFSNRRNQEQQEEKLSHTVLSDSSMVSSEAIGDLENIGADTIDISDFLNFGTDTINHIVNQTQDHEINTPFTVSLEREITRLQPAYLSEAGSGIKYIPLETTDESLMNGIRLWAYRIKCTNNHIALHDNRDVFLFDLSGNFIRKVGRRGQGPGEFSLLCQDLCFSSDGNTLFLLESIRCHEYNTDGKFIKTFRESYSSGSMKMVALNQNLYVVYLFNGYQRIGQMELLLNQNSLLIIDSDHNTVNSFKNYHIRTQQSTLVLDNKTPVYSFNGKVRFKETGSDTLQTVTANELFTYAVFDFGKKRLPVMDIPIPVKPSGVETDRFLDDIIRREGHAGKYFLSAVYENMDNLFFELSDLRNYLYGYFNKHSGLTKVIDGEGFQNDIDGGLPFFPRYVFHDNILVQMVNSFELRKHVLNSNAAEMRRKYGQNWDNLLRVANSLKDDDNQVLVLVAK